MGAGGFGGGGGGCTAGGGGGGYTGLQYLLFKFQKHSHLLNN